MTWHTWTHSTQYKVVNEGGWAGKECFSCGGVLCVVRESLVGPEENVLLSLKVVIPSPPPVKKKITSLNMTNHGDDCYFYYYSTCTRVSNAIRQHYHPTRCSTTGEHPGLTVLCLLCRETAARSDTVRRRWATRPSATSGRRDAASAPSASFATRKSR